MIDQSFRKRTHHHQQLIPDVQPLGSHPRNRRQKQFIEVKVILNYGQQPELAEWFQLPKDLQQMFRKQHLSELKDYFIGGLINVPTDEYPHPEIICGLIADVRITHHFSYKRTRSQFIRYDNLNDLRFLTHDYDDTTKLRITSLGKQTVSILHQQRRPGLYAILNLVHALLALMLASAATALLQQLVVSLWVTAFIVTAISLGYYFTWKYALKAINYACTKPENFRQTHHQPK